MYCTTPSGTRYQTGSPVDAALAAVAGGDRQRRDLDQRESLGRDAREQARVSLVARPGAADEVGQLEELARRRAR